MAESSLSIASTLQFPTSSAPNLRLDPRSSTRHGSLTWGFTLKQRLKFSEPRGGVYHTAMAWIVGIVIIILAILLVYYLLRGNSKSKVYNPSVIVDMDDQPPAEIDFDAGIKANQRTLNGKRPDTKGDS